MVKKNRKGELNTESEISSIKEYEENKADSNKFLTQQTIIGDSGQVVWIDLSRYNFYTEETVQEYYQKQQLFARTVPQKNCLVFEPCGIFWEMMSPNMTINGL